MSETDKRRMKEDQEDEHWPEEKQWQEDEQEPALYELIRDLPVYDEDGVEVEDDVWTDQNEDDPDDPSRDWEYDDSDDESLDDLEDDEDESADPDEPPVKRGRGRPRGTSVRQQVRLVQTKDTRSAAERRKRVSKAVREEALHRLEEAARTTDDFQLLTQTYDREEQSRMRRERRHESLSAEPCEKSKQTFEGAIFPRYLNTPLERQLNKGQFDDYLADCYFTFHDLTSKEHLRDLILQLKPEHREIVFFLYIRLYSAQLLAQLRGQTDRNIRKVRDTVRRKIWRLLYAELTQLQAQGIPLTHQEQQFIKSYIPPVRKGAENDRSV